MSTLTVEIIPNVIGETKVSLDMRAINNAIDRLDEIAIVNEHKAPELMACFLKSYATARFYADRLNMEIVFAEKAYTRRSSIVVLDEVPKILLAKGLATSRSPSGTEAQREAIMAQDPELQRLQDIIDNLRAHHELIVGKVDIIERAYLSVRKMIGDSRLNWMPNSNLSAGADVPEPDHTPLIESNNEFKIHTGPTDAPKAPSPRSAFGKPRD